LAVKFALDTNICISLLNRTSTGARRRLEANRPGEVVMSAIVLYELLQGAMKSGRAAANVANVRDLQLLVPVLRFEEIDAEEASRVRRQLESTGRPIGPYDTLIAGHAKARGLVLATNNVREFSRVDGLTVEDWLGES
jgi:tRNA(fMet)-specific endonuclease VapC